MATQTGSIDLTASNGVHLFAEAGFSNAEQTYATKSELEVTNEAVALRATKTEARTLVNPNLTPFFSSELDDRYNVADNPTGFWYSTTSYSEGYVTKLADGWAHLERDNTSGTDTTYITLYTSSVWQQANMPIVPGGTYTVLAEVRNVTVTGEPYLTLVSTSSTPKGMFANGIGGPSSGPLADLDGELRGTTTARSDFSDCTSVTRTLISIPAGGSVSCDLRISIYEGDYTGPYKPYVGGKIYASSAELKITNDSISTKVEKNGVISAINQSSESVTISADKVNIEGAAIFTGSGRLSEEALDGAYDANGAAAAVQTNLDNLSIGGRNLLRGTADYSSWIQYGTSEGRAALDGEEYVTMGSGNTSNINNGAIQLIGTGRVADYWNKTITVSFEVMSADWSSVVESGTNVGLGGIGIQVCSARDVIPTAQRGTTGPYFFTRCNVSANFRELPTVEDNKWLRIVTKPLTINDDLWTSGSGTVSDNPFFFFQFMLRRNGSVRWRHFQVEEGGVVTDWSLSPEDSPVSGGRNLLLGTGSMDGWGVTNSTTISNGVATFPAGAGWREAYPAENFKYELIRNKTVAFSAKVKAAVGDLCDLNFCIGLETTSTAYARQVYQNKYVQFYGTGEWKTIFVVADVCDAYFTAGTGTVDYGDCWVTVRPGTNYSTGFQLKELQLEVGNKYSDWMPATEDTDADINAARDYATGLVDGVSVGGRNLLRNSAALTDRWSKSNATVADGVATITKAATGESRVYQMPANGAWSWVVGETYTFSAEAKGDSNNCVLRLSPTNTGAGSKNVNLTTEWVRYSYTFTVTSASTGSMSMQAMGSTGDIIQLRYPKLEHGTKPTDWTPAPEDVAADITAVSDVANAAAPKSDAVARTQRVYYRATTAQSSLTGPTTWLATSGTGYGNWSLKVPQLTSGTTKYPYLYTCVQTQTVAQQAAGDTCTCSPVLLDDTTTVIDGGTIITGSIAANRLDVYDASINKIRADAIDAESLTIGQSQVDGLGNALSAKANSSDVYTKAETGNAISTAVDAIEVGGRNLLIATGDAITVPATGSADVSLSAWAKANVLASDLLTVSFDAVAESDCYMDCYWRDASTSYSGSSGFYPSFHLTTSVQHFAATQMSMYDLAQMLYLRFRTNATEHGGSSGGASATISNLKLEKGNKSTDWTPAPEDQTAYVDAIEVGGRNLALDTSTVYSKTKTSDSASVIKRYDLSEYSANVLGTDTKQFVSFDARVSSGTWRIHPYAGVYIDGTATTTSTVSGSYYATTQWQRFSMPMTLSQTPTFVQVTANSATGSNGVTYELRNMKLETGTKPTDWTPAPEDTDSAIAALDAVYGTCSTEAATAAKVVACTDFELRTGARIVVKFTAANTANAPTLNVNSTGDIAIWYNNAVAASGNPVRWGENAILSFVYDGTEWVLDEKPPSYSATCTTGASTRAKAATVAGALVVNGTTLTLNCQYANTYTSNSVQVNLSSTGSASVYRNRAATSTTNTLLWDANTSLTFVRQGSYWYLADNGTRTMSEDAAKTATYYLTADPQNGLMVHDANAPTTGVQITSSVDIMRSGVSTANFGGGTNGDTARVGPASGNHIAIDSDSIDMMNGGKLVTTFTIDSTDDGDDYDDTTQVRVGRIGGAVLEGVETHGVIDEGEWVHNTKVNLRANDVMASNDSDDDINNAEVFLSVQRLNSEGSNLAESEIRMQADYINVQDPCDPIGASFQLGMPEYVHSNGTYKIASSGIDSPTNGPHITLGPGTWYIVGSWGFCSLNSSVRNTQVGLRAGTSGTIWGEIIRVWQGEGWYSRITVSACRTFTGEADVYLCASSNAADPSTATSNTQYITAVRFH